MTKARIRMCVLSLIVRGTVLSQELTANSHSRPKAHAYHVSSCPHFMRLRGETDQMIRVTMEAWVPPIKS